TALRFLSREKPLSEESRQLFRQVLQSRNGSDSGDPDAAVRLAAFDALKQDGDPILLKIAAQLKIGERDPRLQAALAEFEFQHIDPRVDAAKVYTFESDIIAATLKNAESRLSKADLDNFLTQNDLKLLLPSEWNAQYRAETENFGKTKDDGWWWR